MGIRRVVTGHDDSGNAVFVDESEIDPITSGAAPGMEWYRLWEADEPLRFPDDGTPPATQTYFPPIGGFRFGLLTIPPDIDSAYESLDMEAAVRELEEKLPGLLGHMEPDHPGMHTTATVDYEFVVSGRCVLELDNGETRELAPGDTVIQNGTRHAWRNPYDEPCRMVIAIVGAHHANIVG